MTVDNQDRMPAGERDWEGHVRRLIRSALKGALSTIERGSGHPYASLVTLATAPGGSPTFLISRLALHTQNLEADRRASLLIEAVASGPDPLAGARVTLIGRAEPDPSPWTRERFLRRQPAAAMYAGFVDFAFWRLDVERAHFVGGFGRIRDIPGSLLSAEDGIVTEIGKREAALIAEHQRSAATLIERTAGPGATLTGIDAEGVDLRSGETVKRVAFSARIERIGDLGAELEAALRGRTDA